MQDRPPGLLRRIMFPITNGDVVVQEYWDISVPGCPLIRNPFIGGLAVQNNRYVKQFTMTAKEFEDRKIALFN